MNQLIRHNIDILGKPEARKRHLADLRSRNPHSSFLQIWDWAQKEIPESYEEDDSEAPSPGPGSHPYPQTRDSLTGGNPNEPERKLRRRVQSLHRSPGDTEDKMELVKDRIRTLQSKDPKLTFQRAWDSVRQSHPHLFEDDNQDDDSPSGAGEEPMKKLRAELARFVPAKVQADLGIESYMDGFMQALLHSDL